MLPFPVRMTCRIESQLLPRLGNAHGPCPRELYPRAQSSSPVAAAVALGQEREVELEELERTGMCSEHYPRRVISLFRNQVMTSQSVEVESELSLKIRGPLQLELMAVTVLSAPLGSRMAEGLEARGHQGDSAPKVQMTAKPTLDRAVAPQIALTARVVGTHPPLRQRAVVAFREEMPQEARNRTQLEVEVVPEA